MSDREGVPIPFKYGAVPVIPGQLRKWDGGGVFIVIDIVPSLYTLRQDHGFRRWQIIYGGKSDWDWDFENNIETSSEVISEAG